MFRFNEVLLKIKSPLALAAVLIKQKQQRQQEPYLTTSVLNCYGRYLTPLLLLPGQRSPGQRGCVPDE